MLRKTLPSSGDSSLEKCVRPTAIILADKPVSQEIEEIFGPIEAASLVVAGHSLVEQVLLELQELAFEQVIVLAGSNSQEIADLAGDGSRWGMTVNVMTYSCSTDQILSEYKSMSEPHGLLVIEAHQLRSFCVGQFLAQADESEYSLLEAHDNIGAVGLTLLKPTQADFVINAMPVVLDSVVVNPLETARDFHQANFDLVSGVYAGLEPSVAINRKQGRRQHWSSHVCSSVNGDWAGVMIDRHCQVGHKVSLNSVIVNHDVYIEDRAELDTTIVMANSIVPAKRALNDSIVHQGVVFQLS